MAQNGRRCKARISASKPVASAQAPWTKTNRRGLSSHRAPSFADGLPSAAPYSPADVPSQGRSSAGWTGIGASVGRVHHNDLGATSGPRVGLIMEGGFTVAGAVTSRFFAEITRIW